MREPPALPRIYTWFSALQAGDTLAMDELLALGLPVDVQHPLRHTTALMEATRLGRITLVAYLLEHGAAPAFLCGMPKGTPLHGALFYKQWEIAELLLDATRHAIVTDGLGRTLLHVLCMEPLEEAVTPIAVAIAEQLIDKGCPLDALDDEGITALHYCVINDQDRLATLLLDHGAAPDVLTPDAKVTPLAIAALDKSPALATLLLSYGADPNLPLRDGSTPLTLMPQIGRLLRNIEPKRRRKASTSSILALRHPSAG